MKDWLARALEASTAPRLATIGAVLISGGVAAKWGEAAGSITFGCLLMMEAVWQRVDERGNDEPAPKPPTPFG